MWKGMVVLLWKSKALNKENTDDKEGLIRESKLLNIIWTSKICLWRLPEKKQFVLRMLGSRLDKKKKKFEKSDSSQKVK